MAVPHMKCPPGRPPAEGRVWFHEMTSQALSWTKARRVVLVVVERPDQLLLDRFWLITSVAQTAMSAEDLLAHYRRCGPPVTKKTGAASPAAQFRAQSVVRT